MHRSACRLHHVTQAATRQNVVHRRHVSSRPRVPLRASSSKPPADPSFSASRALPWALASLIAGGLGLYTTQLFLASSRTCTNPATLSLDAQKDVSGRYEETADSFDAEVGVSEWLMGVNALRKRLAGMCRGHVLEVSCGTGRNLGYYDILDDAGSWWRASKPEARVQSLTLVDLSPGMLDVCKRKWQALYSKKQDELKKGLVVRFLAASALETMPDAPKENGKYTTIIQTMGLCSTPQPVELLTNVAHYLDTSDPESRILLLEHGRSYRTWLNNILDGAAHKHAEIHGCWFNREIGDLVAEAAEKSGLEVVRERRHHLGTTWLFELKASARAIEAAKQSTIIEKPEAEVQSAPRTWSGWFSPK